MSSSKKPDYLPPRPVGYTSITPRFQGGLHVTPQRVHSSRSVSSTTGWNSNSQVRNLLGPSTRTPASSPRRFCRPVTAPSGGGSVEKVCRGKGSSVSRPKTPRKDVGGDKGVKGSKATTMCTLLAPRRISSSSTCVDEGRGGVEEGVKEEVRKVKEVQDVAPVVVQNLHFGSTYTAHKRHWVKKALESLGGDWVRDGKITRKQLGSEEFEEKISVLYNLAMAKKHEAIDRLVTEEVEGKSRDGRKKKSKGKVEEVQRNFPFSEHLSETVKASMSEMLLRIMTRDEDTVQKKKDRGDGHGERKPNSAKNKEDTSSSSNSFEKSLKKRKRSLVQCYVIDGRLVLGTKDKMLAVGGSFVNKFGESSSSRARRTPSAPKDSYFRRTANMMGFYPNEITIRYCKNSRQLIVSAARPARGNENARQVRETIEVPKDVDVFGGVLVLRTCRGSLIFEEVEDVEEKRK